MKALTGDLMEPEYMILFIAIFVSFGLILRKFVSKKEITVKQIVFVGIMAAIAIPAMLPYLSPANLLEYSKFLGISSPKTEVNHEGPLPQYFGDQFGWEKLVKKVADIYWALPPEERKQTAIFAGNYGEAGAINHFGPAYGLPEAASQSPVSSSFS